MAQETALVEAAREGAVHTLRHIITHTPRINVDACGDDGITPLMLLAAQNSDLGVKLLLDYKASVSVCEAENHQTALHIAGNNNTTIHVFFLNLLCSTLGRFSGGSAPDQGRCRCQCAGRVSPHAPALGGRERLIRCSRHDSTHVLEDRH